MASRLGMVCSRTLDSHHSAPVGARYQRPSVVEPPLIGSFGPWGEELRWRGYAQPRLQQRFGALKASILVGTVWFLWHFWTSLTPAGASLTDTAHLIANPVWFMLLAESVLMAWFYNSTKGSLPIAWAFHAGINLGNQTVAATASSFRYQIILFCAAALVVILVNGQRTLTRSKTERTLQTVSGVETDSFSSA